MGKQIQAYKLKQLKLKQICIFVQIYSSFLTTCIGRLRISQLYNLRKIDVTYTQTERTATIIMSTIRII